jgi:acyl carrier protein
VPSVEERVIEIVSENLGVNKDQITRSTAFIEDLGADSLDIVELVMEWRKNSKSPFPMTRRRKSRRWARP